MNCKIDCGIFSFVKALTMSISSLDKYHHQINGFVRTAFEQAKSTLTRYHFRLLFPPSIFVAFILYISYILYIL